MCWIWIFLPFLFLLERSPADIGLSLIALLFILRSAVRNDWGWMKIKWWQICLFFSFIASISGLMSQLPVISTFEAVAWLRFPLFAVASAYLLSRYTKVSFLVFLSSCAGIVILCLILSAEIAVNFSSWSNASGGLGARLYWPYGDPVPGNYLAKFGLACFLVMTARTVALTDLKPEAAAEQRRALLTSLFFVFGLLTFTILSGERMNTLIVLCSGMLAVLILLRKSKVKLAVTCGVIFLIFCTAFALNPYLYLKFTVNTAEQIFLLRSSGYWQLWTTGLDAFASAPWTGIGPGNFRYLCSELPSVISSIQRCDNHPHNFMVQILAETGPAGLFAYGVLYLTLIWKLMRCYRKSVYHSVLFIVPLAFFFPLKSNADFFGQWNNLMLWYGLALVLNFAEQTKEFFRPAFTPRDEV